MIKIITNKLLLLELLHYKRYKGPHACMHNWFYIIIIIIIIGTHVTVTCVSPNSYYYMKSNNLCFCEVERQCQVESLANWQVSRLSELVLQGHELFVSEGCSDSARLPSRHSSTSAIVRGKSIHVIFIIGSHDVINPVVQIIHVNRRMRSIWTWTGSIGVVKVTCCVCKKWNVCVAINISQIMIGYI